MNARVSQQKTATSPRPIIQPKLMVNAPNDAYEQEADAVADRVMRMPLVSSKAQGTQGMLASSVQRKCAHCEEEKKKPIMRKAESGGGFETSPAFASQLSNTRGGGQAMPSETRGFMESRFGRDFSHVRLHTDGTAADMSTGIQAKAFTHGSDIYFNRGEFSSNTEGGKRLLAHELVHTIQQGKSSLDPIIQTKLNFIQPTPSEQINPVSVKYHQDTGSTRQKDISLGLTSITIDGAKNLTGGQIAGKFQVKTKGTEVSPGVINSYIDISSQADVSVSAEELILIQPDANGLWSGTFANYPNPSCKGKTNIPVTITGNPTSKDIYDKVLINENEHVTDIKNLSDATNVKFDSISKMVGTGSTWPLSQADLISKINLGPNPVQRIADDFSIQYVSNIRTRDSGSHTLKTNRVIDSSCSKLEFTILSRDK